MPNAVAATSSTPTTAPVPTTVPPPTTTTTQPPAPVVINYALTSGDTAQVSIHFSGVLPTSAAPAGAASACPGDGVPVDPSRMLWIKANFTVEITSDLASDIMFDAAPDVISINPVTVYSTGIECDSNSTGGSVTWSHVKPHSPQTVRCGWDSPMRSPQPHRMETIRYSMQCP